MLPNNSRIPECVRNGCEHGKVRFSEDCYPLHSDEGCKKFNAFIGRKVLLVPNPTTAGLICADEDFFYECVKNCCVGSKREYRNICDSSSGVNRKGALTSLFVKRWNLHFIWHRKRQIKIKSWIVFWRSEFSFYVNFCFLFFATYYPYRRSS